VSNSKKILVIYPVDFKDGLNRGIYDKMIGQGEAFQTMNYDVSYAFLEGKNGMILKNGRKKIFVRSFSSLSAKYTSLFSGLKSYCSSHHYDIFYVRHLIHTYSLRTFLKSIKPTLSRIIYEYPTLPYEKEWKKPLHKILLIEDGLIKKMINDNIDLVVHYGGYKGYLPSVKISNGIRLKPKFSMELSNSDVFKMIAVGRWEYWHGLDRLIKGIASSNKKVELGIVGNGPAIKEYNTLVKSLNLNHKVKFHGPQFGNDLEELISVSHLGIGTLGLHRKRVDLDSSLKHRMYCSFGLPFVFAGRDDDFDNDLPFIFKGKDGDKGIDLDILISDYNSRIMKPKEIRNHARNYLTWEKRMEKVLEILDKT
tara:strand:- start:12674 stop:13771 length:1098 start_codon:yes stop_codon:yes gene_type:complete